MAFSSPRKTNSKAETCRKYSSLAPESTRCVLIRLLVCLSFYLSPLYLSPSPLPSSPLPPPPPLLPSPPSPPPSPPSHISSIHLHLLSPPRPACLKQPSSLQLTPSSSNKTRNVREATVTQITQCVTAALREIYHSLLCALVVMLA